ncbi:hypothetical protein FRB94_009278 [Tulasnella sp. JGI-2019a]|nr:hypothetical protein FRB94_009278 [Tulasnella sp. JGI-2019a]KAG9000137.1 hypothetical protein FRB93_012812 [Tulasnella sp. JGI-2019a]KAG9026482.1 hypothetical protein FRB95_008821 [Tulasnella sp. JGI-2019a]
MHLDSNIHDEAAKALQSLSKRYGDCLCPNLRSLRVSKATFDHTIPTASSLDLLLGRSLSDVTIKDYDSAEELQMISKELARVAPAIERLTIGDVDPDSVDNWDMDWFDIDYGIFKQLRVAHISTISMNAWDMLGRGCPLLSEIKLTSSLMDDIWEAPPEPITTASEEDQITFPSLTILDIDCQFTRDYAIATSTMPSLTTLLTNGFNDDEEDILATFIAQRSPMLTNLVARWGCNLATIQALCSAGRLTRLRVECQNETPLDDDIITLIASSLPHLEALSFAFDDGSGPGNEITRRGLIELIDHCRVMTELQVPLNLADCVMLSESQALPSLTITKLTISRVTLPEDNDAPCAAKFLRFWLPRVQNLHQSAGIGLDDSEMAHRTQLLQKFHSLYLDTGDVSD